MARLQSVHVMGLWAQYINMTRHTQPRRKNDPKMAFVSNFAFRLAPSIFASYFTQNTSVYHYNTREKYSLNLKVLDYGTIYQIVLRY